MGFSIERIECVLASIVEENYVLEKDMKWDEGKIEKKIGIKKRYLSDDTETTEGLAIKSINKLKTNINLDNLGLVISVTNTPTNLFPSLSHIVASELNSNNNIHCLGLNSGCSGYVDALILAEKYINYEKCDAIIITSDTYSKYIRNDDYSIRPLFSDGSTATHLKYIKKGKKIKKKITSFENNTSDFLKGQLNKNKKYEIHMNGPKVLLYAINKVLPNIKKLLNKRIETIFLHQAGSIVTNSIIKYINKNINVPLNYPELGNLVSSSIPFVMKENFNLLNTNNQILISGFGVGLSQAHIIIGN